MHTPEPTGNAGHTQPGRERPRQQFCLIEPAGGQPPREEGNGNDRLHAGREVRRREIGKEQPERPGGGPPAAILQGMDRFTEGTVVDKYGSRGVERRGMAPAAVAETRRGAHTP
jgi:hypothetical protein